MEDGIRVKEPTTGTPSSVTIRGDSIGVNGDLFGGASYDNHEAGISIELSDNLGVIPVDISDNHVSRNGFPGIVLVDAVYPVIKNNTISGNERGQTGQRFNLRLEPTFGGVLTTIDARMNFWGAEHPNLADSVLIRLGIYDSANDGTIDVRVRMDNWLSTEP